VDRIKDQKGWNNDQGKKSAASVAVDALREDALLLMSIIAKGHQAAAVKDLSLMKPLLRKRYSTIKTCTQWAKQLATPTQKSGEPVENFYDRTQMAMIIVHEKKSAALVAVDALREDALLLMFIIAKGHQTASVKDWSLMKPLLRKRYSTIKTCTQWAKQLATPTQKSGEPVENFYDRTQMAMIIVQEKPRAAIPVAEADRLRGYNDCAYGTHRHCYL
jgi:hypothetical protein